MPLRLSIKEQQDAGLPPQNGTRRQQPAGRWWGINTLQCLRRAPASGRVCKCCVGSQDFAQRKLPRHQSFPTLPPRKRVQPGSAMAPGPGATATCPTGLAPEWKSTESQQRGRGGEAGFPVLPSLAAVPSGAGPKASLMDGCLRREGSSGSGQALRWSWAPLPAFCPQGGGLHVLPHRRQVGRTPLPSAKSPADRCLATWFFGRRR